jgi:hypothetical protein
MIGDARDNRPALRRALDWANECKDRLARQGIRLGVKRVIIELMADAEEDGDAWTLRELRELLDEANASD